MRRFASHYRRSFKVLGKSDGKVYLESPYPTEYRESSRVVLYTFGGGNRGTILFVHGLGRYNMKFLTYFPRWFASRGYSAALMILPYHFDRTPAGKKSGEMFLDTTDNPTLRSRFEHAVVDVLTSLDFMASEYGYPLYLMGYSFGGMISTIAAAFRDDLSGLSLVVTGGNFYHITWRSVVTRVFRVQYEKNKECDINKCELLHSDMFYSYIKNLERPDLILDSAPMACYEYDPLVFAKFVKAPTIMFSALFDFFIPYASSKELFDFLGSRDKIRVILPSGHITSYFLFRGYIAKRTEEFFRDSTGFRS